MDPGAVLYRSRHLAGLSPSTSPPPLGERTRQSRKTHSPFDSHTMGDHEPEILEITDLPHHVWEDELARTYGTRVGSGHHSTGPSHEDISHFIDSTHPNRWYWILGDETHHSSTNTSTIRYSMFDIPQTGPAPHEGCSFGASYVLVDSSSPTL